MYMYVAIFDPNVDRDIDDLPVWTSIALEMLLTTVIQKNFYMKIYYTKYFRFSNLR